MLVKEKELKQERVSRDAKELFEIDGRPAFIEALPLAFQHIVAMFVGNVAPILIISRVAKLDPSVTTILIQCAMLAAGVATFLQIYPIKLFAGLRIGSKLPVVMGTSFGFLPTVLAILGGNSVNLPVLFGAQIVGGVASILIGAYLKKIRKYFPPLVAGTVVFSIGLSLFPIGINYMAGGVGTPTYGSYQNWTISLIVLATVLFFNQFTKGITKLSSILIGIVVGYVISVCLGIVNFAPVKEAAWFAFPKFFIFGTPKFEVGSMVAMIIMYLVTAIQAVGDLSAITLGGINREVTDLIHIENKIVLCIAIRLLAEKYMINRISDSSKTDCITGNQIRKLYELLHFNLLDIEDRKREEIIEKVLIITSENIHINSFMYEPIVDISLEEVKKLYSEVIQYLK